MKIKKLLLAFCLLILANLLPAQRMIPGNYNSQIKIFETKDTVCSIGFFENGIAQIVSKGYAGLIDSTGKVLAEPQYDKIGAFNTEGIAQIALNGKSGLIDRRGRVIVAPFTRELKPLRPGLMVYKDTEKGRYWGIMTSQGKFITKAIYDFIGPDNANRFSFAKDSTFGWLTPKGKEIVVMHYNNEVYRNRRMGYDEAKLSLNSSEGNIPILEIREGKAVFASVENGKLLLGYADTTGRIIIPAAFDGAGPFFAGYACVQKNGKWGVIDEKGKQVIPFSYTSVQPVYPAIIPPGGKKRFIAAKDSLYGMLDSAGNTIIPFIYRSIGIVAENRFLACKKGVYGVIDQYGATVLPFRYEKLYYLCEDMYIISGKDRHNLIDEKTERWGVITEHGKEVLPCEFDAVIATGNGKGIASRNTGGYSLNTNVPRYVYSGSYFYFGRDGRGDKKEYPFSILIEALSDWYLPESVAYRPPFYFAPREWGSEEGVTINVKDSRGKADTAKSFHDVEELKGGFRIAGVVDTERVNTIPLFYRAPAPVYKKGMLDAAGNEVLPFIYDEIRNDGMPLFIVQKSGLYGVVNLKGEFVIPLAFDHLKMLSTGIVVTKKVYSVKSRPAGMSEEDFKKEPSSYNWGAAVYDFFGRELIPLRTEDADFFESADGQWLGGSSSRHYFIDKQGNKLSD